MGNATSMVLLYVCISMVALIVTLGVRSVDPSSNYLFSNYLFNGSNGAPSGIVGSDINVVNNTWTFNNNLGSSLPGRETTGSSSDNPSSTPTTLFPDWVYSGFNWVVGGASGVVAAGKFFLDLAGAPYTLVLMFGNTAIASIIGIGFSILNLFVIVNWLIGRDN